MLMTTRRRHTGFDCDRTCPLFEMVDVCRFMKLFRALGPTQVNSHVVTVDVEIRDLSALEAACESLGLEFRRGQTEYRWFGESIGDYSLPDGLTTDDLGQCTHAIGLPDNDQAYEVGVVARPDGSFALMWDFWSGGYGLEAAVGENCSKLSGAYTIAAARTAALQQGWMAQDQTDGSLLVYHPSGGTMTVRADGTVDADGFVGQACHDPTTLLAEFLGSPGEREFKASYYDAEARVQIQQGA